MKVWMWQRLWKVRGGRDVWDELRIMENDCWLHTTDGAMSDENLVWLCPKPNLVLVDRKHVPHA